VPGRHAAEYPTEPDLILRRDVLVAEHQDLPLEQRLTNP
jgi:hypothetical protein